MPKLTGNRCQCPTCSEYFNGVQPFDRHRVGEYGKDRRCMNVPEMQAAGFIRNVAGFWCERARAEHATRPRAPAFPTHRAPSHRVSPHLQRKPPASAARAPEKKAGAT